MRSVRRCLVTLTGAILLLFVTLGSAAAANRDPIVLIHGFLGFGRDEMLGYRYWGGLRDFQTVLSEHYRDQKIFTASVGPVSSNWDRAVELYYQIKGGCVDYGAAHAAYFGILQIPEQTFHDGTTCFPGFYPEWDADHPVHLIGHSMGGQDARMLVQLLAENGAPFNPGLFPHTTSAAWIKSVTTISAPANGTVLAYNFTDAIGNLPQIFGLVDVLAGSEGASLARVFDFKLEQWGISPQRKGERLKPYLTRVLKSALFKGSTRNFSTYDLTPAGAMEANDWVKDQWGVTYLSWSTNDTYTDLLTGDVVPRANMNPLLKLFGGSGFIGNFVPSNGEPFPYASWDPLCRLWWPNDGSVDTISQIAPVWAMDGLGIIYPRGTIILDRSHGEPLVPGVWNVMGTRWGYDHLRILGWSGDADLIPWYEALVDRLRGL